MLALCEYLPVDILRYVKDILPIAIENNKKFKQAINDWFAGGEIKNECIKKYGSIEYWDVSLVTDMSEAFRNKHNKKEGPNTTWFNCDISRWNVSNVTDMSYMFYEAYYFNSDISTWNVSKVVNMSYMFKDAGSFDANISKWDVSNVKYMICMFYEAISFKCNIACWNIYNVTDINYMIDTMRHYDRNTYSWHINEKSNDNNIFLKNIK